MIIKGQQRLVNGVARWTVLQDDRLLFTDVPWKVMWDYCVNNLPDDGRFQEWDNGMMFSNFSGQQVRVDDSLLSTFFARYHYANQPATTGLTASLL